MIKVTRFISGVASVVIGTIFFSCNLDDFKTDKLSTTVNVAPSFYAPLVYGTFMVKDLALAPIADNFPITSNGLDLDPFVIGKTGISFSNSAIDSVYLVTHFTNDSQVNIEFAYNFYDGGTGSTIGKTFASGAIAPGTKDTLIKFDLVRNDLDNILQASDIYLRFKLSHNGTSPILYGDVKNAFFTIKIALCSPVDLFKL